MQYIGRAIGAFFKKADMLLLLLCIIATIFGIVAISSATRVEGSTRYVMVQSVALVLCCSRWWMWISSQSGGSCC